MHKLLRILLAAGLAAVPGFPLLANVKLAPLFRDGGVLQRDKNVPVWGWADPGETVTVSFGGQTKSIAADAAGKWYVALAPLAASATPQDLIVTGKNTLTVHGMLVGDVWLCSGQSNMVLPVSASLNPAKEIAAANNSLIRYFSTDNEGAEKPQTDTPGVWKTPSPKTVGSFSATAYFFARELQPKINVPVGIIKATVGGSPIEAWISEQGLTGFTLDADQARETQAEEAAYPKRMAAYDAALATWTKEHDASVAAGQPYSKPVPKLPRLRHRASSLYNSNIAPMIPYALKGFLWYQGEANVPHPEEYEALFATMIKEWRRDFKQLDLPFLFVQLPNFGEPSDTTGRQWAFLREAQAGVLGISNTGMVVTIDIGEPGFLHPHNKQEVGRRLSLLARQMVYHEAINGQAPQAVKFTPVNGTIEVTLSPANNIQLVGGKATDMEIAGDDKKFVPADVKINGDKLIVSAATVPQPKYVRYLWHNAPQACLFNGDGLPVAPFRSDEKTIHLFPSAVPAPAQPAVTWDMKELTTPPQVYSAVGVSDFVESDGIRPIYYDGVSMGGKPTRFFAWLGIPKSSGGKLPAIVLVHGGGSTALRSWVKLWMDRGYVAISMDTGGMMPATMDLKKGFVKKRNPYGGPGGEGFDASFKPLDQQWLYHAVAGVVRADSLLRSLPEVDPERVGVTGFSWGGILTELAAGVDSRFKFAAPVYGSGFLGENSFWLENDFQQTAPALIERWLALWDPSQYVGRIRMPVLFCDGTNDKHFRPDCWQKTYREVQGPVTLSMKVRMVHGGPPAGDPKEITVFADSILRGQPPLAKITSRDMKNGEASIRWDATVPVTRVELVYTTDHDPAWLTREWKTMPAEMDSKTSARAKIPEGTTALFLNTIDERGCVVSCEHWAL